MKQTLQQWKKPQNGKRKNSSHRNHVSLAFQIISHLKMLRCRNTLNFVRISGLILSEQYVPKSHYKNAQRKQRLFLFSGEWTIPAESKAQMDPYLLSKFIQIPQRKASHMCNFSSCYLLGGRGNICYCGFVLTHLTSL